MRMLGYLVEMFIQGFGITRPPEAQRQQVNIWLGGVLLAALLLVVLAGIGMVVYLRHAH